MYAEVQEVHRYGSEGRKQEYRHGIGIGVRLYGRALHVGGKRIMRTSAQGQIGCGVAAQGGR